MEGKLTMAICDWCYCEMKDPARVTCIGNETVEYPDGKVMDAIPFMPMPRLDTEAWMARWREKREEWARSWPEMLEHDSEEAARIRCAEYQARWDRCAGCNVKAGGYHHPGCDNERCPRCGGQLIACGCLSKGEDT